MAQDLADEMDQPDSSRRGAAAFAALSPGLAVFRDVTLEPAVLADFSALTRDPNPLHHDEAFARRLGFNAPVVEGAYLVALVTSLVGERLPGPGSVIHGVALDFARPAHAGDRVRVGLEVDQVSEAMRTVVLRAQVRRGNEVLVRGRVQVGVPEPGAVAGSCVGS